MMWDYEIERLLEYNYSFIGCFPHDQLKPIKRKSNISIIIKTTNSESIGEHWVAMKMTNDKCFYFDSFGKEIINENIKHFANIYENVIYSKRCIQDIQSVKCGEFCIAFVNNVDSIKNYKHFINTFSENLYINDFIVNHFRK